MAKSVQAIVRYFLVAGFVVPCVLMVVITVGHVEVGGNWAWAVIIPWPSFPFIMSAEAGGGAFGEFVAFMQSAVVMYSFMVLLELLFHSAIGNSSFERSKRGS
jgi:hypothetical protein